MLKKYGRKATYCLLILLIFLICGCSDLFATTRVSYVEENLIKETEGIVQVMPETVSQQLPETLPTESGEIFVYVCGCVNSPGVYCLQAGNRIYQAIEAAGGFSQDANEAALNLAAELFDGQQLYIPSIEEGTLQIDLQNIPTAESKSEQSLISINYASKELLMTLPGIGEAKASAVIEYRETQGLFRSIEDIMQVPGIKEAAFLKIKDRITID